MGSNHEKKLEVENLATHSLIHTKKLQTFSMPNIMHAFDHLISAPEEYWYPSFPEYNTSLSVVPLLKFNLFKIKNIVAFELFF